MLGIVNGGVNRGITATHAACKILIEECNLLIDSLIIAIPVQCTQAVVKAVVVLQLCQVVSHMIN